MTWNAVHIAGPPAVGVVKAAQIHDTLAVQLNAHPSGAWTLVHTRTDPDIPEVRIWRSQSTLNGLSFDFYVAFAWDNTNPHLLHVSVAEEFNGTILSGLARTLSSSVSVSMSFAQTWDVTAGNLPGNNVGQFSNSQASIMGDAECMSGFFGLGVSKDGIQISHARTINDTKPQYIYAGAFDSLIRATHLIANERPIMLRSNLYLADLSTEYAAMTRFPMVGTNTTYSVALPMQWTTYLGGSLGVASTQNPLHGVVASRQYLLHPTSMTLGSVRGLAKYVLTTNNVMAPYLNDRLTVNGRTFAWAGPYWYDTTV